jgi:hypothetical protein
LPRSVRLVLQPTHLLPAQPPQPAQKAPLQAERGTLTLPQMLKLLLELLRDAKLLQLVRHWL